MPASTPPAAIAIAPTTRSCGDLSSAGESTGSAARFSTDHSKRHADRDQREARPDAQRLQTCRQRGRVELPDAGNQCRQHDGQQAPRPAHRSAAARRARPAAASGRRPPSARAPTGTLTRNSQRQLERSSKPPSNGPKQKRDTEHGADEPERPAAPLERHGLCDDGSRDRQQAARAERLDRAPREQHRQRPSRCRDQRPDAEQREALDVHRAVARAGPTVCASSGVPIT